MFKKLMLCMAAGTLLLSSCSSDEPVVNTTDDGNVTFTAVIPGGINSRAISDGTTANKLTYVVYDESGNELTSLTNTVDINLNTTVSLNLVSGKTYTVVFWAQADGAPYSINTTDGTITVAETGDSQAENRDAFFAVRQFTVNGAVTETVELSRPFAQVNVLTTDLQQFINAGGTITNAGLKVTAPTVLNLKDGSVSEEKEYTLADAAFPDATEKLPYSVEGKTTTWLVTDYILVGEAKETIDITWTSDINVPSRQSITYTGVPVQRNYRTNIYGALLTDQYDYNVIITPDYEDEPGYGFTNTTVNTAEELAAALAKGGTITIAAAMPEIDLTNYNANAPLTLVLNAEVDKINVKYFADNQPLTIKLGKNIPAPTFGNKSTNGPHGGPSTGGNITIEGNPQSTEMNGQILLHTIGNGIKNVTIKNMKFDGSLITARNGSALVNDRSVTDNLLVENCTFVNMKYPAVYITKGVKATDLDNYPPSVSVTVNKCDITMASDAVSNTNGLYLLNADYVTVKGCTIRNAPYHGIFARGFKSSTIEGNTIINAGEDGIKVESVVKEGDSNYGDIPQAVNVKGNTIASKGNGIRLKCGLSGNTINITDNNVDMKNAKAWDGDSEPSAILLVNTSSEQSPINLTLTGNAVSNSNGHNLTLKKMTYSESSIVQSTF